MFRNRRTSQKPSDDLYKTFKANFPELGQPLTTTSAAPGATAAITDTDAASQCSSDAQPGASQHSQTDLKDAEPTPRPVGEQWNFALSGLTPSLMDPSSHAFNMFANQMPGYYTPTPGGTNTLYHNQAGDLHTPGLGLGLGTPLSLPTSDSTLNAGQQHMFGSMQQQQQHHQGQPQQQMSHHFSQQQHFHNLNPFHMHNQHTAPAQPHHQQQQQQTFAPHQFTHQPSYDHMQGTTIEDSPMGDLGIDVDMSNSHHTSPELLMHPHSFGQPVLNNTVRPSGDSRFRWHTTLNAPTAMIKQSDEIPITYLNKGQAYTLNIVDTHLHQSAAPLRYRTHVRVSFEEEHQRQRPAACWQLWKEGRGTNEAHQRGGRLQAVEYVESSPTTTADDPSKPKVEIEFASFDGFCVQWAPADGSSECPISVRFNFLSTDFSHSKGVKGIPVRLCAKTQIVTDSEAAPSTLPPAMTTSEVSYCKVKLFRDHGAERKLSNDIAHVKKSIDKLNQQIAQIESGARDVPKRKRTASIKGGGDSGRPGKVAKHRRTWSMSSVTSTPGRNSVEEDLHVKLVTLQDMFTSTRPASVFALRGAEEDDPELHPVKLSGSGDVTATPVQGIKRIDSLDTSAIWEEQSADQSSSLVSPSPSSQSLSVSRRDSTLQLPTPFTRDSRVNSSEWCSHPQTATADVQGGGALQQLASPSDSQPVKVQTRSPSGTLSGWVEALGVDHTYQPPPERLIKPVACFYVQPRVAGKTPSDNYHRAIYLMNRTLKDFVNAIAVKCDIEPTAVKRTVRISRKGMQILFDDDCIRELPEGQDMTAEFSEVSDPQAKPSRQWDVADIQCDGDLSTTENVVTAGYELTLLF